MFERIKIKRLNHHVYLMDEVIACMQEILETKGEGDADYTWFDGVDKVHTLKSGNMSVCYPKELFEKD
ncbi:MAG: hypothetical protein PUF65_06895 [Lachnospiraceae bacterium]|nr:hypothetical protein [Lachnospiraceae bacterium]